ncbi:hypothetical protein CK203_071447 [Vitis vinifera]|uniref:FHA domain-containing protein n=1 Tax=Vitis vinifera TaxID=29760 RepID=A0A438F3F0_VITVI|nr:hypothetical protein CK203_071447 [Vitis vinifera]
MVETRRSSSSSKRRHSPSGSSPLPSGKRSKSQETASSSSEVPGPLPEEALCQAKESGSEHIDQAPQPSDPPRTDTSKASDACDVIAKEKSTEAVAEGEALVAASPLPLVDSAVGGEKSKSVAVVSNRGRKRSVKSNATVAWGKLLSQCSQAAAGGSGLVELCVGWSCWCVVISAVLFLLQYPHQPLCGPLFTIGQSRASNLSLRDPSISNTLCRLRHIERGGASVVLLEITGGKGVVQVNGKIHQKSSTLIISGGDELVFSASGQPAYIFQQFTSDNLAAPVIPSSVSILEAQSAPVKGIHVEARSGDPSAVDGASILASLSNLRKDLSLLPPPKNGEDVQQGTEMTTPPCGASDSCIPDADMKDAENNDVAGVSSREKTDVPSSEAANENLNLQSIGLDACTDTEIGKVPGATYELRPLLRMLAGSSSSDFDLSGSISKILEEQREIREILKDLEPPMALTSTRRQAFKDSLQEGILSSDDIEVSFESFPYYLSDTTKNVLITSTYIHLMRIKFAKYTMDLSSVCPRILLSGPAGSEIYQETLTKALAKHFTARLLIVDSLLLPGGSTPKDPDPVKENMRGERASIFAKRAAQAAVLQHKKPASSVEADITGASTVSSRALPKQETSTATSKNYIFKAGMLSLSQNKSIF